MLKVKFKKNEKLLKILNTLENILSANTTENKLKLVKFANINSKLCISGRNPHTKIEYILENIEEISGDSALYECKMLNSLLNVMDEDIEINDGVLKCKKVKYNIPCSDDSDYPKDIFPEITNWYELNFEDFKNSIANVAYATDKVTDGALSGVYIGENKLIACDSKRIFMQDIVLNEQIKNNILPKELIKNILKMPFKEKAFFTIFGENIIIKDENITIASAMLSSKYPKVEALLPKNIKNTLTIKKDDFYNALSLVMPIIDEDTKACNLEYNNQTMRIYVDNGVDKAETQIKIESKNDIKENIKVKFNIQLLVDMLKVNQETIEVKTYEDNIGYMFSSNGSMQYIMPIIN